MLIQSSTVWPLIAIALFAYSIAAVELIIKWNSISGVYNIKSTGQVIPLVIGAGAFLKVMFGIYTLRLYESKVSLEVFKCPSSHRSRN